MTIYHIKKSNKKLKKLAQKERQRDIKKWVKVFFLRSLTLKIDNNINLVFDIEQVLNIIKDFTKSNYSRSKNNIKIYIDEQESKKNNFICANEIIYKAINDKSILSFRK